MFLRAEIPKAETSGVAITLGLANLNVAGSVEESRHVSEDNGDEIVRAERRGGGNVCRLTRAWVCKDRSG